MWYRHAVPARAATWGYMAHEYNSAMAFSSTSPMMRMVVGSVSTSIDVDAFANSTTGTIVAFSMMALPSWVDAPTPVLGIRGKTTASEMGVTGGSSAVLADDGMVRGPGTAAPVPPPCCNFVRLHALCCHLGTCCPSSVAIPLPRLKLLGIGLQPALGPVNSNTG